MSARKTPVLNAARSDWAYFLDLDGTLVDIAATPGAICVGEPLLLLLEQLRLSSGGAVALISGRALSDLDQHLGALRLPSAGQYGLERRDAAGRLWLHAPAPQAKQLLREALQPWLARHSGLLLEDKGLTLALHYRQAPRLAAQAHGIMARLLARSGSELQVHKGKYLVEAKPAGFDKGTAIAEYLAEPPYAGRRPVFIGDDLSDESGFALVNQIQGISIKVGAGKSCAQHRLPDVAAVLDWLSGALSSTASGEAARGRVELTPSPGEESLGSAQ